MDSDPTGNKPTATRTGENPSSGILPPQVYRAGLPGYLKKLDEALRKGLAQWRNLAWEDDVSRNNLDDEPFENLPPPSELPPEMFNPGLIQRCANLIGKQDLTEEITRDRFPIPAPEDRERYSVGYHGNYWLSGFQDFVKICQVAEQRGVDIQSYLDFGCASGRVVRHFCAQQNIGEIWATDINARHIRWLCEFLPANVKPVANHSFPSLPIPDHSIDVISAFSVFTHLDTFELGWLAELSRILKPGGFAYVTVHNEDTWRMLRDEIENPNNRLVSSMIQIDPDTPQKLKAEMPNTRLVYRFTDAGPYRAQVFHSNQYLQQFWGRFFNIKEIIPGHHVRQTVVVMTKK